MIENLWLNSIWLAVLVGTSIFAAEHYLALYEMHLYHAGAASYIVLTGRYAAAPSASAAAARSWLISAKFVTQLVVLAIAIGATWQLCVRQFSRPELFSFLIGGLVLYEAAVCTHHFRNIVLFRHAQRGEGVQGKIAYSRRLVFTLSFVELYSFTALYFLMFLLSGQWFFFGGALTCLVAGNRLRDWTVLRA